MNIIKSPLGAIGALMVFLEGISGGSLFAIQDQPLLQKYLVFMMIATIGAITMTILLIIVWFAFKKPGLLFNPQDIDPSVHLVLYGGSELVSRQRDNVPVQLYRAPEEESIAFPESGESR